MSDPLIKTIDTLAEENKTTAKKIKEATKSEMGLSVNAGNPFEARASSLKTRLFLKMLNIEVTGVNSSDIL